MRAGVLLFGAAAAAATLVACGSARRGEPLSGQIALSPAGQHGEQVLMRACNECHPKGEAGLGPAINNKPLPGFLMKIQVRHGLGAMPNIDERWVAPEEMDDLITYLNEIRAAREGE
jgi:mono/diheme cytochrome c family protein